MSTNQMEKQCENQPFNSYVRISAKLKYTLFGVTMDDAGPEGGLDRGKVQSRNNQPQGDVKNVPQFSTSKRSWYQCHMTIKAS